MRKLTNKLKLFVLTAAPLALRSEDTRANGASRPIEIPVTQSNITTNADLRDRNGMLLTLRVSTPAVPAVDPLDPDRVDTGVTPAETAKAICGDFPIEADEMHQKQEAARSSLITLILQLEDTPVPRHLTNEQRNVLAQIPVCEPFMGQLRTITQYLQQGMPLPEAHPAQPAFQMNISGVAFFNDINIGTGIMAIRVNQQVAFFRLNRPIELSRRGGRPLNLQWVGASPLQSGQGLGIAIEAIGRSWADCATDYRMTLTNVDNAPVAQLIFRVDEGRCYREDLNRVISPGVWETDAAHE